MNIFYVIIFVILKRKEFSKTFVCECMYSSEQFQLYFTILYTQVLEICFKVVLFVIHCSVYSQQR